MRNIVILSRNSFTDLDVKLHSSCLLYIFETTEIHSYAQTIFYNNVRTAKIGCTVLLILNGFKQKMYMVFQFPSS